VRRAVASGWVGGMLGFSIIRRKGRIGRVPRLWGFSVGPACREDHGSEQLVGLAITRDCPRQWSGRQAGVSAAGWLAERARCRLESQPHGDLYQSPLVCATLSAGAWSR